MSWRDPVAGAGEAGPRNWEEKPEAFLHPDGALGRLELLESLRAAGSHGRAAVHQLLSARQESFVGLHVLALSTPGVVVLR